MLASVTLTLAAWLPPSPTTSFRAPSPAMVADYDPKTYNPEQPGLNVGMGEGNDGRPEGSHGTGYRFMPMLTVDRDTSPAVVCIAGIYPGLTVDQLNAPQPVPFAPPGKWNYHMLTGAAAPGGFVAIPGSAQLDSNPDTVAVVCGGKAMGLEFPDGGEHEVLALITRSCPEMVDPNAFNDQLFYALADPQGTVHIRWMESVPADWKIVGRLLYTQMPNVKKANAGGGFAEMSDEFEF